MVEREITISFDELLKRPLIEDWITLCCVSNPVAGPYIGNAKWLGASLASLLREARPRAGRRPAAVHLHRRLHLGHAAGHGPGRPGRAARGGHERRAAAGRARLPGADGDPRPVRLRVRHQVGHRHQGDHVPRQLRLLGPARLVAAGARSRPSPASTCRVGSVSAGRTPVAGVAWAQHKGIDAVHVRVDRGPWQQARLAAVPGIDTWRQWAWEWDATPRQPPHRGAGHRRDRATPRPRCRNHPSPTAPAATRASRSPSADTSFPQRKPPPVLPRNRPAACGGPNVRPGSALYSSWSRIWPDR